MTNGFLVPVPHERLHGTISILEQRPKLPTNVRKVRAVKDIMALIAYRMRTAQRAPAQLPGDQLQSTSQSEATCRSFTAKSRISQYWLPVDYKSTEIHRLALQACLAQQARNEMCTYS